MFFSIIGYLLATIVTIVTVTIAYFKWTYQYFARKNIPYLEPQIPLGNVTDSVNGKECYGLTIKRIYNEMKKNRWRLGGMFIFASPKLLILDLDLIKDIMTKDSQYFVDRNSFYNESVDPLSAHLANLTGTKWKILRNKLTPMFTSGKIKIIFQTLAESLELLHTRMERVSSEPVDIRDVVACFATDIIGSCAFGLDCKAIEDDDSPFRIYGRKATSPSSSHKFKRTFASNFPRLAHLFQIVLTDEDVTEFFIKTVQDTVNYRENNNIKRDDFLQMLIDLKNSEESLTINEIAAQCFVFFLGGFETSSTLMAFALYELARHQDLQEKLRIEIKTVLEKYKNEICYEAIQDMKFLNQVIDETLRLYPPAPTTNRKCEKDYKIADENIIIEKGANVIIPIMGIHHDPDYYPDPMTFDPDRFSDDNKVLRHNYTHLPFGEGPRGCIGMRFGLLQTKIGLTTLLQSYRFKVNSKTIEPLKFKPSNIILAAVGEIWLDATKIK